MTKLEPFKTEGPHQVGVFDEGRVGGGRGLGGGGGGGRGLGCRWEGPGGGRGLQGTGGRGGGRGLREGWGVRRGDKSLPPTKGNQINLPGHSMQSKVTKKFQELAEGAGGDL